MTKLTRLHLPIPGGPITIKLGSNYWVTPRDLQNFIIFGGKLEFNGRYLFVSEENMEKYSVELNQEKIKTAEGDRRSCPTCGRELEKVDGIYINKCPSHGTEPFEAYR